MQDSNEDQQDSVDRREVLKRLGASALVGGALGYLASEARADERGTTESPKKGKSNLVTAPLVRSAALVQGGSGGGAIKALISTQALRDHLRPFVFFDHFNVASRGKWGFAFHPHSGIATFTYPWTADLDHKDTGGNKGRLLRQGVQWMGAGGGVWHEEYYRPQNGRVEGLQLWVVLPPDQENGGVQYQAATAAQLPQVGATKVLAGTYNLKSSPIRTPYPFNYFDVKLEAGAVWQFKPPAGHNVAWTYNYEGNGHFGGRGVRQGHLVVYSEQDGAIHVQAGKRPLKFVFASAQRTPWPVVVQRGSMHTSREALKKGSETIRRIGSELRRQGKI